MFTFPVCVSKCGMLLIHHTWSPRSPNVLASGENAVTRRKLRINIMSSSAQPTRNVRQYGRRALIACTACRTRKVRCRNDPSGLNRPCQRCRLKGYKCVYQPVDVRSLETPEEDDEIPLYDPYSRNNTPGSSRSGTPYRSRQSYPPNLGTYPPPSMPSGLVPPVPSQTQPVPVNYPAGGSWPQPPPLAPMPSNSGLHSQDINTTNTPVPGFGDVNYYQPQNQMSVQGTHSAASQQDNSTSQPVQLQDGSICYGTLSCFCGYHRKP
ncbi:hypothetical protein E1B28_005337 [Marasmius oreades]|uniref:Zn(2)-C6 fungal-type domain-containing protein n=1 Tax=Marasmius oreades TaxID=181124 RepID=A0A9P7S4C2_9AGAR|nr:uncharacterized protein E1B28_005337 [Marasmius oreades]KAG7094506.1 hypothetical protein E1B28_005337 [Marasmius oreades]